MSEAVLHPFFSRERTIAAVGFNRWLVPPAALAIHLCIGMAYGFSVFWLPLGRALGIAKPQTCGADISLIAELFTTTCDWRIWNASARARPVSCRRCAGAAAC